MTAPTQGTRPSETPAAVIVLFGTTDDAERGIAALREAGYTQDQIGIAMRDRTEQKKVAEATGAAEAGPSGAAEGAAVGALSGGVIGGLVGLLGSLLIPGVGPVVAGGVLATTLAGAGIGAATGGIVGALIGMGASEEEARHFDKGFKEGNVLVTVAAPERAEEARQILRAHHADVGPVHGRREAEAATAGAGTGAGARAGEPWRGTERRVATSRGYSGPERRREAMV